MGHFAVKQRLAQHCKSTTLQLKKKNLAQEAGYAVSFVAAAFDLF